MVKVAINGFGRIGRNVLRSYFENNVKDFDVVAINNPGDISGLAHLFKYDSCFGIFQGDVEVKGDKLVVNGKEITVVGETDPAKLPWAAMGIDIVVESTGLFTKKADAEKHITAGAKKVVISAPATDEDVTVVMGVNEEQYDAAKHNIVSNASCTTNCLAPFAKVIDEKFGIVKGLMTTVHSYTNDQRILDQGHKDLRRSRAAAESIIPTTTGAAKAVSLVLPQLKGKLNGFSMRVPTPTVSVVDLVVELAKPATKEEINAALKEAADGPMKGILGYTEEPLVSIDFRKDARSSIIDALSTMVIEGNMAKVVSWYDNEWGYSCRVVDLVSYMVSKGI